MNGTDPIGPEYSERSNFYKSKELSWSEYGDLRPKYPDKIYDTIADYMKEHNRTEKTLAVDYGAGTGKAIPPLLQELGIHKVLANDLNEPQLKDCELFLGQMFEQNRFDTIVGAAGELDSIPEKSVDLVTAAECVHWFHVSKWLEEVARVLRPSGTLAIWYYPLQPAILSHPDAVPACNRVYERFFEIAVPRGAVSVDQMLFSTTLMDSVAVDPKIFSHQARYKWLYPQTISKRIPRIADLGMVDSPFTEQQAQAGLLMTPEVKVQAHVPAVFEDTLMRADNWTTETLLRYIRTGSVQVDSLLQDHVFQESMQEIEKVVGGPEATFSVGWQVALLLATRC